MTEIFTCPSCGGHRMRPCRAPYAKLFLGLLAPRNRVRCLDCGTVIKP